MMPRQACIVIVLAAFFAPGCGFQAGYDRLNHEPRGAVVVDGGLHVRGWITPCAPPMDYGVKVFDALDDTGRHLAFRSYQRTLIKGMWFDLELSEPAPAAKTVTVDVAFISGGVQRVKWDLPIARDDAASWFTRSWEDTPPQADQKGLKTPMKTTADREDDLHLPDPFWKGETAWREGLFFIQETDDSPPAARLLFVPLKVVSLRSADGRAWYEEGKDYRVEAGAGAGADGNAPRIVLTKDSRIPFRKRREMYPPAGAEHSIGHRVGDPNAALLFGEGHWFHAQQEEVTYLHAAGEWKGFVPKFAGPNLPVTMAKLAAAQGLSICILGDSIAEGGNASRNVAPFQPAFPELVGQGLEKACGVKVTVTNLSKGGKMADYGVQVAPQAADLKPDLVLIAFGMNDVSRRDANRYQAEVARIIEIIRAKSPQAEFILVASMLANPEWAGTPAAEFPKYRQALTGLCGKGVVLADVTGLWAGLFQHKNYHDLTGNGVNHANDYGHRLYAQTILGLLVADR
jgi:acyl-CoA thioesterase I